MTTPSSAAALLGAHPLHDIEEKDNFTTATLETGRKGERDVGLPKMA